MYKTMLTRPDSSAKLSAPKVVEKLKHIQDKQTKGFGGTKRECQSIKYLIMDVTGSLQQDGRSS